MLWLRSFPAHGRSTSRTATICLPSGTRSIKQALLTSLTNAHEPCAGRVAWPPCNFEFVLKDLSRGSRGVGRIRFMAQFQTRSARGLDKVDPVWARIRNEAEDIA